MLNSLRLENWKSFGAGEGARNVVPFSPLTLLVGPNGSGKSNVLDAIRFLRGAALDYPLGDVLRGQADQQRPWPGIRGGLTEAARQGAKTFALESKWSPRTGGAAEHLIEVEIGADATLTRERLRRDDVLVFEAPAREPGEPASHGKIMASLVEAGDKVKPGLRSRPPSAYDAGTSILRQLDMSTASTATLGLSREIREELGSVAFFDIQPSAMRNYQPASARHLGWHGENISPTLAALPRDALLQDIVDWLSELSPPGIGNIEFDRTKLDFVMLFVEEQHGRKISAASMSDGTLRFLGVITAMLTATAGAIIVLEEPDVGLHPSRIHLLAKLLEHITGDRGVQVIATTHSPTLLAHLGPEPLRNVVALGRDPETGLSVASRIGDLQHADKLIGSDHLDRLISTGWLERAL